MVRAETSRMIRQSSSGHESLPYKVTVSRNISSAVDTQPGDGIKETDGKAPNAATAVLLIREGSENTGDLCRKRFRGRAQRRLAAYSSYAKYGRNYEVELIKEWGWR